MRSIERYLLAWTAGALSLGLVLVALVGYLVTLDEMHEVFNDELRNVAAAVARYPHAPRSPQASTAPPGAQPPPGAARAGHADEAGIVTTSWTLSGERLFASDPAVALPFTTTAGLSRALLGGEAWRVYTMVLADGVVQTAQRDSTRRDLAGESAAKVVPPMLLLAALTTGLVIFALRRGLESVDATASDVAARSAQSLEPIPTAEVPREILPLVAAVNGLMGRLSNALTAQRRFLADAAHELRTPAAALRLQLQLLERSTDEATRTAAMAALRSGVDRSQHLIEQLLQVARSGPEGEPMHPVPVDLGALARQVVAGMSARADERQVDLGARVEGRVIVTGDAAQLTILLNNLVDNALRYTPAGGVVDLAAGLREGRPALVVSDSGPGIAADERERVFDRFYRGARARAVAPSGSGLGLAIVRAIADRHGAQLSLHDAGRGTGLQVRVAFPPPGV
jgi:signal transduction histidine kinase